MRHRIGLKHAFCLFALGGVAAALGDGQTIRIASYEDWVGLEKRLQTNPAIREVVVAAAVYHANLSLDVPKGVDPALHPLLIRAEEGAEVVLDGSEGSDPVQKAQPDGARPGVFGMDYVQVGNEYPKLWEPANRVRYRLVADVESVARFPATYTVEGKRLLFHTSDGQAPAAGAVRITHPYLDYGFFIRRPYVTVRGFTFRNYLVREKGSTAIQLVADHVTVEDCTAENCSVGFTVIGNNGVVRGCRVEDCGGGIYVGGRHATVEKCRLFKRRDTFMVPMYAQDDTGIQFYYPAEGGTIRGNLCVGFREGIFIKAEGAPYRIEHNTVDGGGQGVGFGATKWTQGQRFRYNLIVNCARELDHLPPLKEGETRDIASNVYWSSSRTDLKPIGAGDLVADPRFVWAAMGDYRLANDSPALKLADADGPAGAFPALGSAVVALGEPREWHVSEKGRDGRAGTSAAPVKTIQFAVDRAKPGDTIIVHPGLYPDPVSVTRGGTAERPLVIRGAEPWRAILDSNREAPVMISVSNAPYVQIRDLEIRWYGRNGISIDRSAHVTVAGCRIWNAHWRGGTWPTGNAIYGYLSPNMTVHGNVLFKQEHGVWLHSCPNSVLTSNTCAAHVYSAASLLHSAACVIRNNSFAFQGNDVLLIQLTKGQVDKLKEFDCDYNNYGTSIRQAPPGLPFDNVDPRPRDSFLACDSKAIVNYTEYGGEMKRFETMDGWRAFSGLDRHTLFVDPLYRDAESRDFRLEPGSPNIGAGKDGATIGALTDKP